MDKAYGNILEVAGLNSLILRFDVGGSSIVMINGVKILY